MPISKHRFGTCQPSIISRTGELSARLTWLLNLYGFVFDYRIGNHFNLTRKQSIPRFQLDNTPMRSLMEANRSRELKEQKL